MFDETGGSMFLTRFSHVSPVPVMLPTTFQGWERQIDRHRREDLAVFATHWSLKKTKMGGLRFGPSSWVEPDIDDCY